MRFNFFESRTEAHIRKSLEYLDEANLAWVEHQAAAEHHAALANMYAGRVGRIELEIKNSHQQRPPSLCRPAEDSREDSGDRAKSESVLVYPARAIRQ